MAMFPVGVIPAVGFVVAMAVVAWRKHRKTEEGRETLLEEMSSTARAWEALSKMVDREHADYYEDRPILPLSLLVELRPVCKLADARYRVLAGNLPENMCVTARLDCLLKEISEQPKGGQQNLFIVPA